MARQSGTNMLCDMKALDGKDMKEMLTSISSGAGAAAPAAGGAAAPAGGAAAAEEKKPEKEEGAFSLFSFTRRGISGLYVR